MECGDAWRVRLPVTQYNQAGSNPVHSAIYMKALQCVERLEHL